MDYFGSRNLIAQMGEIERRNSLLRSCMLNLKRQGQSRYAHADNGVSI